LKNDLQNTIVVVASLPLWQDGDSNANKKAVIKNKKDASGTNEEIHP
jgi:hypothetical protein